MEIRETTQYRKRGRPFGTSRKEPGRSTTVHVPERVQNWLDARVMKLAELVSDAPNWYDRMLEQTNEIKIGDVREKELEEQRETLRRTINKLTEENAELMRFRERVKEKLKTRGLEVEA